MSARLLLVPVILIIGAQHICRAADHWSARREENRVTVSLNGQPLAVYTTNDPTIKRPFFAHLRTTEGRQVTRSYPPVADQDSDDHADMHPGIWMSFGDLSGQDFWRNKAHTEQDIGGVTVDRPGVHFLAINDYLADDKPICRETCKFVFEKRSIGYAIRWTSTFEPAGDPISFGDQEEMGLGVRMHTPLIVQRGGQIQNSSGQRNEAGVWGKPADWCQYSGTIDGRRVGVAILPGPTNFRQSWWHVRDYGLMVANPFGRNALTGGDKSSVTISKDKPLVLNFAVLIFDVPADNEPDIAAEYEVYAKSIAKDTP